MTREQLMSKPATFSKLMVAGSRFSPAQAVQSLELAPKAYSEAPSKAGLSTLRSRALIRAGASQNSRRSMKQ